MLYLRQLSLELKSHFVYTKTNNLRKDQIKMKFSKRKALISILTCSLLSLTISSLFSCSSSAEGKPTSSDTGRLAALESQLASMQANNLWLESEYLDNIAALESEIASLKQQTSYLPPASSELPEESSAPEYFGFGYIEENGYITIVSYNGKSTELIIPASINGSPVVHIADNAFENTPLVSVSIPETLKSIGWFAFSDCSDLERIIIPKNVTEIGYSAFSNTRDLVIYAPKGSYAYQYAKSYGLRVSEE